MSAFWCLAEYFTAVIVISSFEFLNLKTYAVPASNLYRIHICRVLYKFKVMDELGFSGGLRSGWALQWLTMFLVGPRGKAGVLLSLTPTEGCCHHLHIHSLLPGQLPRSVILTEIYYNWKFENGWKILILLSLIWSWFYYLRNFRNQTSVTWNIAKCACDDSCV